MTRTLKASAAAAVLAFGVSLAAQSVPEIPFDTNIDVVRTPLDGSTALIGEVGGVGQNSKGQIFVYTRTGHFYATIGDNRTFSRYGSKLFQFDRTGKFERELGQDVYGFNTATGLRIDPQDNIWTIDDSASQVVKFDPQGRIALVLGRKPETIGVRPNPARGAPPPAAPGPVAPGAPAAAPAGGGGRGGPAGPPGSGTPGSNFNRPSDVAWDRAGNIYVADGMGNTNRVAKMDKDGRFLKQWGSTGSENGQFHGLKAIAIDALGNVYVADAGNKRIQVFDAEGTYKSQFGGIGTPLTMCISPGPTQYLYISHSGDPDGMVDAAIFKVALDGKVVGKFGSAGRLPKQFGLVNSIDCRSENELLIGEMANWRIQKVTLRAAR